MGLESAEISERLRVTRSSRTMRFIWMFRLGPGPGPELCPSALLVQSWWNSCSRCADLCGCGLLRGPQRRWSTFQKGRRDQTRLKKQSSSGDAPQRSGDQRETTSLTEGWRQRDHRSNRGLETRSRTFLWFICVKHLRQVQGREKGRSLASSKLFKGSRFSVQ